MWPRPAPCVRTRPHWRAIVRGAASWRRHPPPPPAPPCRHALTLPAISRVPPPPAARTLSPPFPRPSYPFLPFSSWFRAAPPRAAPYGPTTSTASATSSDQRPYQAPSRPTTTPSAARTPSTPSRFPAPRSPPRATPTAAHGCIAFARPPPRAPSSRTRS